jgi:hypothetical protein
VTGSHEALSDWCTGLAKYVRVLSESGRALEPRWPTARDTAAVKLDRLLLAGPAVCVRLSPPPPPPHSSVFPGCPPPPAPAPAGGGAVAAGAQRQRAVGTGCGASS